MLHTLHDQDTFKGTSCFANSFILTRDLSSQIQEKAK